MKANNAKVEVEVKKRLWTRSDLARIEAALSARASDATNSNNSTNNSTTNTNTITSLGRRRQRDVFVDQDARIAASEPRYSVFRLRTSRLETGTGTVNYVATVKGPTVLENGIARTDEDEVDLPFDTMDSLLNNPNKGLATYANPFLDRLVSRFSLNPLKGVTITGEYTTIRSKYRMDCWIPLILASTGVSETPILELDETLYEFGSAFEIEVETAFPEFVEQLLMGLLKECGCADQVSNSTRSKYTNFLKKSVDGSD